MIKISAADNRFSNNTNKRRDLLPKTKTQNNCKLCGLPATSVQFYENDNPFCCLGCREVYRHFGDSINYKKPENKPVKQISDPEGNEAFLRIDGMHCSSCEILIEKIALKIDGIKAAMSSYATSTVKIIYDPDIIDEIELPFLLSQSGYKARFSTESSSNDLEGFPYLRLLIGENIAVIVMMLYLAFYYPTHLGLVDINDMEPIKWLVYDVIPIVLFGLICIMIFYVGIPIFRGAWVGFRARSLNMDNLLVIAILAAFGYSVTQLILGSLDLYFDVVATIIAVVTIGRYYEKETKAKATKELTNLMQNSAPMARVYRGDKYKLVKLDKLNPKEHIVVREGESIPVDGTILSGKAAIDESLMTGEPFPVTRSKGEKVLGGTIVVEGDFKIEAGHVIESQMDNLARILWNAQSNNKGIHSIADKLARIFVPTVLILAIAIIVWLLFKGSTVSVALLAGMTTLIVSCPCTFGLAIPLARAIGLNRALRKGIIMTSADIFEKVPQLDTIAIDKTGILSSGIMKVSKVYGSAEVASYAAAVEKFSAHPIAEAIANLDTSKTASEAEIYPGMGVLAIVDDKKVAVGSRSLFIKLGWNIPDNLVKLYENSFLTKEILSYVGWDGCVYGAITTQDKPRDGWERVVDKLKQQSKVVLLSGAENAGCYADKFDEVFAGVPPEGKAAVIRRLQADGTVGMIGDGSNDSLALAAADIGIAFGAPSSLAADAADLIIPGNRLEQIFDAFNLIRTFRLRVRQNLGWALLYNISAIPLALFGFINPLFAAIAMATSSLLVVWNSTRASI